MLGNIPALAAVPNIPQTCIGGGTEGAPAAGKTMLYSPVNSALGTHSTEGTLLPSIVLRGSGSGVQSDGICKLFTAMHDHADSAGTTGTAGHVKYGEMRYV